MSVPDKYVIQPSQPGSVTKMPSLSFLLQHSFRPDKFLFDLGIRRNIETYPALIYQELTAGEIPVSIPQTVIESLAKGGLTPDDIDHAAISHVHWDHIGNTERFTGKTKFILSEEGKGLIASAYPENPKSEFLTNIPPAEQTVYLPVKDDETVQWKPVGPFPRAYDFYGDGSLYIVDSPGHLPGHINILARTSADGSWIFLAGDSVHHWHIMDGTAQIAVGVEEDPTFCMHRDLAKAEEHIERIKEFDALPRTEVILAHDEPWYEKNKGGPYFFPGSIPAVGVGKGEVDVEVKPTVLQ